MIIVQKRVNIRKFEKQADDLVKLLTTDELHKFDMSNVVEDCKFNLKKSRNHSQYRPSQPIETI